MKSFILVALMLVPGASMAQSAGDAVGAKGTAAADDRNVRGSGEPEAAGGSGSNQELEGKAFCNKCEKERRAGMYSPDKSAAIPVSVPPANVVPTKAPTEGVGVDI